MWSNVVEETGEPGENHRTWTGDHYPATCLDPDSNPDRRGDKRVRYPLRYPGPPDGFLPYMGMAAIFVMLPRLFIYTLIPQFYRCFT